MNDAHNIDHSDESILLRLIYIRADKAGLEEACNPYKGRIYTVHEFLEHVGIYGFIHNFIDGRQYQRFNPATDWYASCTVTLQMIDIESQAVISAKGLVRLANRYYELDLYHLRARKSYFRGFKESRTRMYRRPKRMAVMAMAYQRDRDEDEPAIRCKHLCSLRYCYESLRTSSKDRSWKRHRKAQYR